MAGHVYQTVSRLSHVIDDLVHCIDYLPLLVRCIELLIIFLIYTIILLKSACLSVDVNKLQVAILARSSREMYQNQTVRID